MGMANVGQQGNPPLHRSNSQKQVGSQSTNQQQQSAPQQPQQPQQKYKQPQYMPANQQQQMQQNMFNSECSCNTWVKSLVFLFQYWRYSLSSLTPFCDLICRWAVDGSLYSTVPCPSTSSRRPYMVIYLLTSTVELKTSVYDDCVFIMFCTRTLWMIKNMVSCVF